MILIKMVIIILMKMKGTLEKKKVIEAWILRFYLMMLFMTILTVLKNMLSNNERVTSEKAKKR